MKNWQSLIWSNNKQFRLFLRGVSRSGTPRKHKVGTKERNKFEAKLRKDLMQTLANMVNNTSTNSRHLANF
jgi:hypothetical protein